MLKGKGNIILKDIAYIPGFLTNLVSGARTRVVGVYFDSEKEYLYIKGKIFCHVKYVNGLPFI